MQLSVHTVAYETIVAARALVLVKTQNLNQSHTLVFAHLQLLADKI